MTTHDYRAAVDAICSVNGDYPAFTLARQAEHRETVRPLAEAVIDAGFTRLITLTTAEELDACVNGTIILIPTLITGVPEVRRRMQDAWGSADAWDGDWSTVTVSSDVLLTTVAADHKVTVVFTPPRR